MSILLLAKYFPCFCHLYEFIHTTYRSKKLSPFCCQLFDLACTHARTHPNKIWHGRFPLSLSLPSSLMSRSRKHGRRSLAIRRVNMVLVRTRDSRFSFRVRCHFHSSSACIGNPGSELWADSRNAWQYDISTLMKLVFIFL